MPKKDYENIDYKDRNGNVYVDVSDVVSGLYKFANFTRAECKRSAQEYIEEVVPYMRNKSNFDKPWKERTGEATKGLSAEYFEEGSVGLGLRVGVKLKHGVSYGVFLEYNGLYHEAYLSRRRPVLVPTMKSSMAKEFLVKMQQGFRKIAKQMR